MPFLKGVGMQPCRVEMPGPQFLPVRFRTLSRVSMWILEKVPPWWLISLWAGVLFSICSCPTCPVPGPVNARYTQVNGGGGQGGAACSAGQHLLSEEIYSYPVSFCHCTWYRFPTLGFLVSYEAFVLFLEKMCPNGVGSTSGLLWSRWVFQTHQEQRFHQITCLL